MNNLDLTPLAGSSFCRAESNGTPENLKRSLAKRRRQDRISGKSHDGRGQKFVSGIPVHGRLRMNEQWGPSKLGAVFYVLWLAAGAFFLPGCGKVTVTSEPPGAMVRSVIKVEQGKITVRPWDMEDRLLGREMTTPCSYWRRLAREGAMVTWPDGTHSEVQTAPVDHLWMKDIRFHFEKGTRNGEH